MALRAAKREENARNRAVTAGAVFAIPRLSTERSSPSHDFQRSQFDSRSPLLLRR